MRYDLLVIILLQRVSVMMNNSPRGNAVTHHVEALHGAEKRNQLHVLETVVRQQRQ